MAKAKFDLKSIDIPNAAQKPLYAGVGAGDLALTAVKEYVSDVQKRITDVQKSVTDFDAKKARKQAADAAAARRAAVETRVSDLQKDALEIPTRVQTLVNDNVAVATATYTDLAKRGEALVRGTKLPSSVSAEVKVNPTHPGAKKANTSATAGSTKKSATKKAPAKKSTPAKKTTAKTTAKKA
jgi:hypothetical protein